MDNSPTLASATPASKPGLWHWLLRITGLEAWFRQAPSAAHVGHEERILLTLTLAGTTRANRSAHTGILQAAQRECQASIAASGGTAVAHRPDTLLLTWPIASQSSVPLAALYFQLQACVRRLANSPSLGLNGAAGLGWATLGAPAAASRYEQTGLREVMGLLHESQRLGSDLLLTAALHQRLAPAAAGQCTLHVAFEVPGHRYPATLFRVAAPVQAAQAVATEVALAR